MAGNNNGIQLPVSLQISNLQDIANQLKQFANKNVLSDSLGGKKIDSELGKLLTRLEQISAKSKTAFTTQADFSSVQKEINQVELGLNKVHNTIKNLGFDELKIPEEFSGQIAALQGRIRELNGSLATFKGTQKEKLVSNVDFMADLQKADPKQAAKWLEKGYDELQKSINEGMAKVNTTLALRAREFEESQKIITQNNHPGKIATTQLGALSFIQEAFKALPKDDKTRNTAQVQMADFMKATADEQGKMEFSGFNKGAQGLNSFLKYIANSYQFTPEQMSEIKARLKQQVAELAKEGQKVTQTDVIKAMGHNEGLAKQILFGDKTSDLQAAATKYASDIKEAQKILQDKAKLEEQQGAFTRLQVHFDIPNKEIAQKSEEIAAALKVPTEALQGFQAQILSAATSSPQLTALFQKAAGEISTLTNTVEQGKQRLASIDNTINKMQGISNFVNRYVGLYAVVRKVTTAIRNAFNNIKELDKAITSIAVVTNMSQQDLWGKIGEYTQMAQQYGVATKDVYEVSQIFYQQGLQTTQVMQMTTESLKMAKIAGIDYSTAANAMTVAVRAFKLEMSEAQSVTDTYSALAAKFAVSSSEIANAMEKTASSAASVGMSLQSTSAFISVMEQTTRESAQNIGSALKSIISRYGEMKASPDKLLNVEGEEVAFNKVDTALASIGISIKDASGQFRDFDDVIMELSAKWDSLDNNTQRYIATIMAGNRQQSRFIALVSNYDELSRAMNVANNAENASIVQVAKTMDSLESKANQLKNAFSQIYLDLHAEEGLKNIYDWLTRILKTIGKLGVLKGVLPTLMNVIGVGTGVKKITNIGMQTLQERKQKIQVETDEAQQKIEEIRTKASEDIHTQWKIEADLSQLETTQRTVQSNAMSTAASLTGYFKGANSNLTSSAAYDALRTAYNNGQLEDPTKRAAFIQSMGIDPNSERGNEVDALLQSFATLKGQADQLGGTLDRLKNASDQNAQSKEQEISATNNRIQAEEQATDTIQQSNQTRQQEITSIQQSHYNRGDELTSSEDLALAKKLEADKIFEVISSHEQENTSRLRLVQSTDEYGNTILRLVNLDELATENKIRATYLDANATEQKTGATQRDTGATGEHENAVRRDTGALGDHGDKKAGSGAGGWVGHETAMKVTGLATGIARLAGTAITAAGAAHRDKSTDTVETSKLLTGVGNGLSMAGTGASMGMAFGPWGAAIGAIGGFLVGGLGAIIDGATMTLEEQLALEKEEAKAAADESLKAQAKTIDLENSIDNIRKLREAMYNSTEDMEAYKDAMSTMANQYPSLISNYDEAGNAIIDLNAAENLLAETRLQASQAANQAAKAEAKTRQTTIDILNAAQEDVTNNYQQKKGGLVPNVVRSFMDKNGQAHAFEMTEQQWSEILSVANNEQKDIDNMSFNDFINFMRSSSTSSLLFKSARDSIFNKENAIIDDNGSVKFAKEYDYSHNVGDLNNKLKSVSDKLNITPTSDLPGGAEYIYAFMGWKKDVELTAARMQQVEEALINRTSNYKGIVENLDKTLPVADAQESLDRMLLDVDAIKATKISTSKIASKLIANQLEAAAQERNMDAGTWSRSENEDLVNAYEETKTEAAQIVVKWFTGLSDKSLDATLNAFNSMTDYLSLDQMLQALGYTDKADFKARSGLSEAESSTLLDSWQASFLDANIANRDRIIKTIYGQNENGSHTWDLNTDFKEGLGQLDGGQQALDIAYKFFEFDGTTQIISKYADYFTTQLLDINKLAEEGYTQLASTRLAKLDELASLLASNPDMQQDLFGIITNIDFTSHNSIQSALDKMQEYAKSNNIEDITKDSNLWPLYEALTQAANDLIFNVNTLAQEVTTKITDAASKIDSIIATNKSGLSFDKAIEEFNNLSPSLDSDVTFDSLFNYDAVLGKYVYSNTGLAEAISQTESTMQDSVAELTTTKDNYAAILKSLPEFKDTGTTSKEYDKAGLKSILSNYNLPDDLGLYEEQLINSFFESGLPATLGNFYSYIQEQIKNGEIEADKAEKLLANYKANKKNQYYQAIDWSKLALGTDFSDSNKELMQSLAQELGMVEQTGVDENGKAIFEEYIGTWEEVLDEYLNETYADDNARKIAKTAINSQIKQQKSQSISTAITELLQGAGSVISEETAAILQEQGKLDLINKDGLLQGTRDVVDQTAEFIKSARDIFDATKDQFATATERNKAYAQILTAEEQKDIDAISVMSNAFGMTYDTLGEILGRTGEVLDEWLVDHSDLFEHIGGGKIRITDFTAFANEREWQLDSEEYTSAFKEYNNNLINYNKHVSDQIKEEFNSLSKIDLSQGTQEINLTRIAQAGWSDSLESLAVQYDALFKDGILTVTENTDLSGFVEALGNLGMEAGDLLTSETQALVASLSTQKSADIQAAFKNITSNYKSISIDMIKALAKSLDADFNEVAALFKNQGDGTYKTDLSTIWALINTYQKDLTEATKESIFNIITTEYDSILNAFGNASNLVTSGTSSMEEMQKFAQEFSTLMKQEYTIEQLFNYDAELNVFKLNTQEMHQYAEAQRSELEKLGLSGEAINDYINSQTIELMQTNIDILSVLESSGTEKRKANAALISQIKELYESQGKELEKEEINRIVKALNAGGEEAVKIVKELKGDFATAEELEAVFNARITPLRTAMDDLTKGVGETVSGISVALMREAGYQLKELDDGSAIITQVSTSVENMVAAYLAIYKQMVDTAGHTQADLNNAYAQVLTAGSKKNVDALETLENASGMTYEAFAELLNQYEKDYETILATGFVKDNGFGNIEITDFDNFAKTMGWNINSPQYTEAYSNWVDSMIEARDNTVKQVYQEKVAEQISSLADAKVGQSINVAYLQRVLGTSLDTVVNEYSATLKGSILTLKDGADIPGLIAAVAERAAEAGAILPDQLAELVDTVDDMLSDMTGMINDGIDGKLNKSQAAKLTSWASANGIEDLTFTRTADGLKLSNDSARTLYNTMKDIDSLQGSIIFDKLKDNLIDTEDAFKNVYTTEQHVTELTKDLAQAHEDAARWQSQYDKVVRVQGGENGYKLEAFEKLNGNANLYKRPYIDNGDGSYSTILGTEFTDMQLGQQEAHILMTPIPEWAENTEDIMTSDELDQYIQWLMDQHPMNIDALLELDAKGTKINGTEYKNLILDTADAAKVTSDAFHEDAIALHEWSDAWEQVRKGITEAPDNRARIEALNEELALAQKIQNIRATSENDSFKFMEQDIPAGQNNPLNYFENWAKAYEAMEKSMSGGAGEKGYMEYQDFYNLVTQMGELANLTGEAVHLGGRTLDNAEAASALITEAAGKMKITADGKMKVDLSGIGIDFKAGAEQMNKDVDAGIDAVADAQIDMLDSMIKLLEVIVAMEKLGDVDVDQSGSLELGEIFKVDITGEPITNEEGLELYTEEYQDGAAKILAFAEELKGKGDTGLSESLDSIRINGYTLREMFEDAADGVKNLDIGAEAYQAAVNALYQAMLSDDYDLNNIGDSLYKILEQAGLAEAEIDVEGKTFYIKNGTNFVIDWNKKDITEPAEKAFDEYINAHSDQFTDLKDDANIKDKTRAIQALLDQGQIDVESEKEIKYHMGLLTGDILINEDTDDKGNKTNTFSGSYKGKTFSGVTKEKLQELIAEADKMDEDGFDFEFEGKGDDIHAVQIKRIGSAKIKIVPNEDGTTSYEYNDQSYDSLDAAIAAAVSDGNVTADMAGQTYESDHGVLEARYNSALNFGYVFNQTTGYYEYKGQRFASYDQMLEYINTIEKNLNANKLKVSHFSDTLEIIQDDNTVIYRNLETGETIYRDRKTGVEFKDANKYAEWLSKKKLAGDNTPVKLPNGNTKLTFTQSGYVVDMEVDSDGNIHYTVTIADLGTFTASSEQGLRAALATAAKLQGKDKTLSDADAQTGGKGIAFTFTSTDGITVDAQFDGDINVKEGDSDSDRAKEIVAAAKESLQNATNEESSATTVTATVGGVDLDATSATATITLPETISSTAVQNVTVSNIDVDASTAAADITLPETISSTAIQDVTVAGANVSLADDALVDVQSIGQKIHDALQEALNVPIVPNIQLPGVGGDGSNPGSDQSKTSDSPSSSSSSGGGGSVPDFSSALAALGEAVNTISTISTSAVDTFSKTAKEIDTDPIKKVKETAEGISTDKLDTWKSAAENISTTGVTNVQNALSKLKATVTTDVVGSSASATLKVKAEAAAKGNVNALAKGNNALAGGTTSTLMGELGPELVVSNGRYFIVGQNGAEFVDLAKDAIVFNHKQTERLMSQGMISSRGVPFTNETNAISFAKGNVTGPAKKDGVANTDTKTSSSSSSKVKISSLRWAYTNTDEQVFTLANVTAAAKGTGVALASASAALAALKQLRAMWESLQKATAKDLAGLAGSHGGGGGGGGKEETKAFIKELEKWYKWLQKIAELETKINKQEALRNKLASENGKNGSAYYASQKKTLDYLRQEVKWTQSLLTAQQAYFEKRRNELNDNGPFNSLYRFDSDGQLTYKKGQLEKISKLLGTDQYGKPNMTAKQQYEYIVNTLKIDKKYLQYDSSGQKIDSKDYAAMVQAFWDRMDADKEEMQSLHDSINQYDQQLLELQQQENELIKEMQDNQIELENAVLDAIIENSQREIDKLTDLKDAYSDATTKMINGLSDALNKEKEQYDQNQSAAELLQLRRRLALLQRSGGSASEISNLKQQISEKEQAAYFDEQQRQIDSIQEAADKQIERLDEQIDILTQTLDYQKKYGLLWNQVYAIMAKSPEEIASFIQTNTEEYWDDSPLVKSQTADDWFFKAKQWEGFRNDLNKEDASSKSLEALIQMLAKETPSAALDQSFNGAMSNAYGSWFNNAGENAITSKAVEGARQAFQETYAATGDFQAAMAAAQGNKDFQTEVQWQDAQSKYLDTYGDRWNNISDETKEKIHEAYSIEDKYEQNAVIQEALKDSSLYSKTEKGKKQFKAVKENGVWVVKQVKANSKGAVKYNTAYQDMQVNNGWDQFAQQCKNEYAQSWTDLSANNLKTIKAQFKTEFNKVGGDLTQIDKKAVLKGFTNKLGSTGPDDMIWSVKPNSTTNSKKTSWSVVLARKETKEPTTYANAKAEAAANRKLYNDYKNKKAKGQNPKVPKYSTKYQYDIGGMVEHTGTALLHAKESVLTSQQTDILRNEILGKQNNSLLNLLLDFRRAYNNLGGTSIESTPSIIIENASVNMHVDQIANDYDARRAGEQALAEMLKIARKNGAASTLRR